MFQSISTTWCPTMNFTTILPIVRMRRQGSPLTLLAWSCPQLPCVVRALYQFSRPTYFLDVVSLEELAHALVWSLTLPVWISSRHFNGWLEDLSSPIFSLITVSQCSTSALLCPSFGHLLFLFFILLPTVCAAVTLNLRYGWVSGSVTRFRAHPRQWSLIVAHCICHGENPMSIFSFILSDDTKLWGLLLLENLFRRTMFASDVLRWWCFSFIWLCSQALSVPFLMLVILVRNSATTVS